MMKPKVLATKLVQKAKRVRGNNDDTTALVLRLTRPAAGDPAGVLELDESSDGFTDEDALSLEFTESGAVSGYMAALSNPAGKDRAAQSISLPVPTQPPIITRHKAERAVTVSLATPRAIGTPRQTPPRAGAASVITATTSAAGRRRHRSIGGPL
jgi:hypothetical protein